MTKVFDENKTRQDLLEIYQYEMGIFEKEELIKIANKIILDLKENI